MWLAGILMSCMFLQMNNLGLPLSWRVIYDYVLGKIVFSVYILAIKLPEVTIKLVFNPEVPTAKSWGSIFSSVQSSSQQTQAKSPWTILTLKSCAERIYLRFLPIVI